MIFVRFVSSALMVCLDQQKPCKFSVGAGRRLECHTVHSRDLAQIFFRQFQNFQTALHRMCGLQRMNLCKSRQSGHFLIDSRVILHSTGAKRIKSIVHAMGLLRQFRVMSAKFSLDISGRCKGSFLHLRSVSHFRHIAGRQKVACVFLVCSFQISASLTPPLRSGRLVHLLFTVHLRTAPEDLVFIQRKVLLGSSSSNAFSALFGRSDTVTNSWKNSPLFSV